MNKTMTATAARKDFFNVIEAAGKPGRTILITREGMPPVVMMSADEFEGWVETLEIMSDPELVRDLRKAMKERGTSTITLEELEKEMHTQKPHVQRHPRKSGQEAISKVTPKGSRKGAGRAAGASR